MSESSTQHYDIAIVGGGMVGAMLAAALSHTQLRVAVLESHQPEAFHSDQPHDLRVSALSLASERMLTAVGAWDHIRQMRCCPFRRMAVEDGEAGGSTEFFSGDIGETHLGHIVENRVIQLGLMQALKEQTVVEWHYPVTLESLRVEEQRALLTLDDKRTISARLVIGADGARSKVREQAGIAYDSSQYPQHALVATVATKLPQQSITWQRFLPTGPQAFLPLSGHNASIVWYHTEDELTRLKALTEEDFINELESAFPATLGGVDRVIGRASFPLSRSHAAQYVKHRVALIGDAAHTVHPLAGQGVNLGLLDAAVIAQVLIETHQSNKDIGQHRYLRQYERWRRSENGLMIEVLDGFYHAFKPQAKPVRRLRSLALDLAQRVSPARHLVARYAVGNIGDLPKLAKGHLP